MAKIEEIIINEQTFNRFFDWLNEDRQKAEKIYIDIRSKLITFFSARNCLLIEELVDETFDRVIDKVNKDAIDHNGKPLKVFYGFAKNIFYEQLREKDFQLFDEVVHDEAVWYGEEDEEENARIKVQLKKCLTKFKARERNMILDYYNVESGREKEARKNIAKKYALKVNSLRVKVFRLKNILEECVEKHQNQKTGVI